MRLRRQEAQEQVLQSHGPHSRTFTRPPDATGNGGLVCLLFFSLKGFLVFSVKFYFLSSWAESLERRTPTVLCHVKTVSRSHTSTLIGTLRLLHGYGRPSKIPIPRAIRTSKVTQETLQGPCIKSHQNPENELVPASLEAAKQAHIAVTPSWRPW